MNRTKRNRILDEREIQFKIQRMAHEIHENCFAEKELLLIGIQGRGFDFAKRLHSILNKVAQFKIKLVEIELNKDYPTQSEIRFKESVILVDDVLNSGKTLAYAVAHILQLEPKLVKTAILVNREHHRFPVTADFVGLSLATTLQEHIQVVLGKSDGVYLT